MTPHPAEGRYVHLNLRFLYPNHEEAVFLRMIEPDLQDLVAEKRAVIDCDGDKG